MFKSKYIFETKNTRYARILKNFSFIMVVLCILYIIASLLFVLFAHNENRISKVAFFKRPPDLIVVFTGQTGRIPHAISLAKNYKSSPMFITGVNARNSVKSILSKLSLDPSFDPNQLHIDYLARNTVENVLSTRRFLNDRHNMKSILIISHDYHLMRIKLITNSLQSFDDSRDFYYTGVDSDYSSTRNIKILFKEVFKFIRTYGFLTLWTPENS